MKVKKKTRYTAQLENLGLESQVKVKGMPLNNLGTVASTKSHFGSLKAASVG